MPENGKEAVPRQPSDRLRQLPRHRHIRLPRERATAARLECLVCGLHTLGFTDQCDLIATTTAGACCCRAQLGAKFEPLPAGRVEQETLRGEHQPP